MYLRTLGILVFVGSGAVGCPAPADPPPQEEPTPAPDPVFDDDVLAAFEAEIDAVVPAGAPGASVGIWQEGSGVFEGGSGDADLSTGASLEADTPTRIASLTKSLTACLVLALVDEGAVELDVPFVDYLADAPVPEGATVRHLLAHTAGTPDYATQAWWEDGAGDDHTPAEILEAIGSEPPTHVPGEGWAYSNSNYFLLGLLVEAVTGDTYADALRGRVLAPAGMTRTYLPGYEDGPTPARGYVLDADEAWLDVTDETSPTVLFAAGGLASTGGDLLRYVRALDDGVLLSDASQELMLTAVTLDDGTEVPVSLGFAIIEHPDLGTVANFIGGIEGYSADLLWLPDLETAAVVALNSTEYSASDLRSALFHALPD